MTSEQMRAELEREGYINVRYYDLDVWILPDGITRLSTSLGQQAMTAAYAHLQAQRKLAALEAFVLGVAADITSPDIGDIREDYNSAIVKVFALIEQFNITADESDNDE